MTRNTIFVPEGTPLTLETKQFSKTIGEIISQVDASVLEGFRDATAAIVGAIFGKSESYFEKFGEGEDDTNVRLRAEESYYVSIDEDKAIRVGMSTGGEGPIVNI